jgi:hypothetical protein
MTYNMPELGLDPMVADAQALKTRQDEVVRQQEAATAESARELQAAAERQLAALRDITSPLLEVAQEILEVLKDIRDSLRQSQTQRDERQATPRGSG